MPDWQGSEMNTARDETSVCMGYEVLAFGPFRLDPVLQILREGGKPLRLGSRAVEILLALVERAGETVSKNELLARVWPESVVEEGTLRVHLAALRKILGESESGVHYIANVAGRGYRFAAHVTRVYEAPSSTVMHSSRVSVRGNVSSMAYRADNLPAPLTRMVGRAQALSTLVARVRQRRFVTLVGPGGIGKTTLAVSVADALTPEYPQGVCFVDLALIREPRLVSGALAAALGLAVQAADPLPGILTFLREKSLLVVLDNCEHVIEVAASLVESVQKGAPGVHVLATSREPLRAEEESVHRLEPLGMPAEPGALSRREALAFPALQLFVERAQASQERFELEEGDVPLIVEICRRLDGNPLAIELAAGQVVLLGVRGLAASLDQGLHLLIPGRRTALPRQQTLHATLDWSYELLSACEQAILRRLAVFVGSFDLQSARAVAADEQVTAAEVFAGLASLAAKSLLVADVTGERVLYRLLDMPRAYALEKLRDSEEFEQTQRRHAEMWCTLGAAEIRARHGADWFTAFCRRIDDLRAALGWCFSPASGASVRTKLILASSWFEFALAAEYGGNGEWAERSIHLRPASEVELVAELDAMLAEVLPHLQRPVQDLTVGKHLSNGAHKRRTALWDGWFERLIVRDYRVAINISESFEAHSSELGNEPATASDRVLTLAHYYAGRQSLARRHAERLLNGSGATAVAGQALQLCYTRALFSRILWIQGFPDQAIRAAQQSIAGAQSAGNPHVICYTLLSACAVATWCGDLLEARRVVTALREYSTAHALEYYQVWANCCDTALAVRSGELAVEPDMRLSDDALSSSQNLEKMCVAAEELVSLCAIVRAEHGRGGWCTPEILRVNGERMLTETGSGAAAAAEEQFQAALETARRQEALSFELRAAMSLARLWRAQQRIRPAQELLAGVYDRFSEGFGTADLVAAGALLQDLAARQ